MKSTNAISILAPGRRIRAQSPGLPRHLSPSARNLAEQILKERDFNGDAAAVALLVKALEAFDAAEMARRHVAKHGPMLRNRFSELRANPMLAVAKNNRQQFVATMRVLGLDIEMPQ